MLSALTVLTCHHAEVERGEKRGLGRAQGKGKNVVRASVEVPLSRPLRRNKEVPNRKKVGSK